ncbi:MAG: hypothetical protein MJZ49_00365 [Bacteroidales bacterium]|nr:hypothetical protein [Bacteroidales bacterium]
MKNKSLILWLLLVLLASSGAVGQNMMHTKHYRSHFTYQTGIAFNAGVGQLNFGGRHLANKLPNFCVDQVIAYQFNPYFTLGVDLGLNVWKKTAFIPVALHMSVDFMDNIVSPHWYLNGGYSFKWYVTSKPEKMTKVIYGAKPGWYINTGLGAKIRIKEQIFLVIAADYKTQYSTIQYSVDEHNSDFDYSSVTTNRTKNLFYHFVGVKFALLYW